MCRDFWRCFRSYPRRVVVCMLAAEHARWWSGSTLILFCGLSLIQIINICGVATFQGSGYYEECFWMFRHSQIFIQATIILKNASMLLLIQASSKKREKSLILFSTLWCQFGTENVSFTVFPTCNCRLTLDSNNSVTENSIFFSCKKKTRIKSLLKSNPVLKLCLGGEFVTVSFLSCPHSTQLLICRLENKTKQMIDNNRRWTPFQMWFNCWIKPSLPTCIESIAVYILAKASNISEIFGRV